MNDDYEDDGSFRVPSWLRHLEQGAGIDDEDNSEDDRAEYRSPTWSRIWGIAGIDDEQFEGMLKAIWRSARGN